MLPQEQKPAAPQHRGLLVTMSALCLAGGAVGLGTGFLNLLTWTGPFVSRGGAGRLVQLALQLFVCVLFVSAGITGLRRDARTGARVLGTLSLAAALCWLGLALAGAAGPLLPPLLALIFAALYLLGAALAGRPPAAT